jgi:FAD dependent oxidoreductase TIGR03364
MESYDDAVVGAGILGLAHAYQLAKRGHRVVVFERNPRAMGASVRNFGMLWPIGQPFGPMRQLAQRSLMIWHEVLRAAGIWHDPCGSLHLAYRDDEWQVLREFAETARKQGHPVELLDPQSVRSKSPAVCEEGLIGGIFSAAEICVDPRQVLAELPEFLHKTLGVEFHFGSLVRGYDAEHVVCERGRIRAERLWVCSGEDLQTLYPDVMLAWGLRRCKLQMMRSQPFGTRFRLGPMLAAGLTLRHYQSFANCPSLPALKDRVAHESPEFDRYGIHVMASQNGHGEIVIGDSHEYDQQNAEPFAKTMVDQIILDYLRTFLAVPDLQIAERWQGVYVKHPTESYLIAQPCPGVTLVNGVGGNGMTLSFGLAEQVVNRVLI